MWLFACLAGASLAAAWAINYFLDGGDPAASLILPASYLFLGVLVKYGDQAFDADAYSQRTSLALALPGGLWMGSLMLVDAGTATLFLGMLLALLAAGKLDNRAFQLAFGVAMVLGAAAAVLHWGSLSVVGIGVVFALALLDEKLDALPAASGDSVGARLLRQRPLLKLGVLVLVLAGILPSFMYLFAFLSFDFGYSLVDAMSTSRWSNGRA